MSKNPVNQDIALYDYLKSISVRETTQQQQLRELSSGLEMAAMQISPDQGQFMALLVKLLNAKSIVEVGTFTGYSALSMALALPEHGRLIACDISDQWTAMGKPYWKSAGVSAKIDLRIGPAVETLTELIDQGLSETVDMVFIDADKTNYHTYYEQSLRLVKPNGLIVIDNVFWGGAVIDTSDDSADTVAIRELNQTISNDERVDIAMISVGDGLFLVRKK